MTRPSSPFAAPPIKRRPAPKRDTAGLIEKVYVRQRDRSCVVRDILRVYDECQGPLEVDHVRASGALSKKSVTHRSNMVLLCHWHHKLKTDYGRVWRPLLLAYLERIEG